MILERGTLLNNRYRIVEILGQGGMGSVYRAIDENLGVEVAVKDNLFSTDEYARQFRREALILANLRHPNLPRVTDHFILNGQGQYLVMDYIDGEDLRQRMERIGLLPEEDAILIGAAVCDALGYLGTRNPPIIHRDLKPGNVKITPSGEIFLVDFGLAKTLIGSQATTTGARAMTPGYSPPEQYGTARTDQRSDIFSLGATLYAALTGTTPEDALARAMDQAELTPIRRCNSKVSKRLAGVIEKALQVRPDDRYQTAEEFKKALLGANYNTRRRDGVISIAPPPWTQEESADINGDDPRGIAMEGKVLAAGQKSPPLLPVSIPITDHEPKPRKAGAGRGKRRGCLPYLVLVGLALIFGFAWVYRYNPRLLDGAYKAYWPAVLAAMPNRNLLAGTQVALSTSTPTRKPAIATSVPITPTPNTINSVMKATETTVPLPSPTFTAIPSLTPTLLPTPIGGALQIAFASNLEGTSQIYIINSDGTNRRKVTNLAEGACQPDWSPDGMRLVFISPCSGNSDYYPNSTMYIINVDGKGLLPLLTLSGGDYDPKWSPDGRYIVFTSLRDSGRPRLYILNLEDNSVRDLSDKYSTDFQASWSPDGSELVFVSTRRTGQQIWAIHSDGTEARSLSGNDGRLNSRPSFSPDGKSIVFTQYVAEGSVPRVNIVLYSAEDFEPFRVSNMPMRDAVYSPDGYWLAFEGWEMGSGHDLYIILANGAGISALTDDAMLDFDPAWRPVP